MPTEKDSKNAYATVIADLEAQRAALDSTIASLKAAAAMSGISVQNGSAADPASSPTTSPFHSGEIPAGAFLRKSIPEAAKLYLSIIRKKQTAKEIAAALIEGGMETKSKNFEITVATGLHRASRNSGEFAKLKGGAWGLAEWYPSAMRITPEKRERRNKGRKVKRNKSKEPKVPMLPEKSESTLSSTQETQKLGNRIVQAVREHPTKEFTKEQMATALGVSVQTVAPALARLLKKGSIRMPAPDTYGAAQS